MSLSRKITYALAILVAALGGVAWWWFHRPAPPYQVKDAGIYPFTAPSADGKSMKTGFIDALGDVLIQPQWDDASLGFISGQAVFFNEDLCAVKKDGKWGFIDKSGNLVIPAQFDQVHPFVDGTAAVAVGDQWGFIDKTGHYLINPQFKQAGDFHDGLAAVEKDFKWGFVEKSNTFFIRPRFDDVQLEGFADGLAVVTTGGRSGFIDRSGKLAIRPQFDDAGGFSDGLAPVRIGDKWGYINTSGSIVINPQFTQAGDFFGGHALVSIPSGAGTIDRHGKYVINPGQYNLSPAGAGFMRVYNGDGLGLMNLDGNWILHPSKAISSLNFVVGKAVYVAFNGGTHLYVVSTAGNVLTGPYKGAMAATLSQDIQDEADAIQTVHAIVGAEAAYSSAYPAKGFTDSLERLGSSQSGLPDENHAGLINLEFPGGVKSNYKFSITIPAGTSTAGTNFNYLLTAKDASGHFGRTLCADSSQTVHYTPAGQECNIQSPSL